MGRARLVAVLWACACQDPIPPYGEVVLEVDTDLPVPALAARLRVDVFAEDGAWSSSRDLGLPREVDWPVSFGVFTRDEDAASGAIVRLRAYSEGKVRDYLGERFSGRPTYVEDYAHDLASLCGDPPTLEWGRELTLRRGPLVITDNVTTSACAYVTGSGAVAARVSVTVPGTYRFEVMRSTTGQSNLYLRTDCALEESQIACAANPTTSTPEPSLVVDLEPGDYTLIATSSFENAPADVTLRGSLADAWDEVPPVPAAPEAPPLTPRLVQDGVDVTPKLEPQPRLAIDRLVHIVLEPGRVQRARVTLRGACLGTMARLSQSEIVERVVVSEAESCVDVEAERRALDPLPLDASASAQSAVGTFGVGEPCEATGSASAACIPGGAFVLGSPHGTFADIATLPERVALMPRFHLDQNEVSVARYRAALAGGFAPSSLPVENGPGSPYCPWTEAPGAFEEYAVACVNWYEARELCQWWGGDLPTEAQWEYAASAAGRALETRFPWGDDPPTCDVAVFGRDPFIVGSVCVQDGVGPLPVDTRATTDVTPQGVANLAGNLFEWTLDSGYSYDHPCFEASGLHHPQCVEVSGPRRVARGGAWNLPAELTKTTQRFPLAGRTENELVGFRCAYSDPAAAP